MMKNSWIRGVVLGWSLLVAGSLGLAGAAAAQDNTPATESSPEALRVYEGARNAQGNNSFELAAEEWGRFLTEFPNDPLVPKVRYYQGVCYLQLRQWDKAIPGFARVVKDHPKFELLEDAYLNLGWCQFSAAEGGKPELYAEAAKSFEQLLEKFPKGTHRDEAYFFLGDARYLQGQRAAAIAAYEALINQFPESRLLCNALYALGVVYEEQEQFGDARLVYDRFLESCADHDLTTEVRMRKAETLLQTGSVADAEKLFAAVAAVPGFAFVDHALYRRGVCLSRLDQFEQAADMFVRIVRDMPESSFAADAEISAGRAYQRIEKWDAATQWLGAARKRGGEHAAEATHWLCRIKLAQQQPAEAEQLAAEALPQAAQSAFFPDLRMDHADALYDQPDKRSQALVLYLKIAEDHEGHRLAPQALYNAAFAALELKDYDTGLKLVQQFLTKYPDDGLLADARFTGVECHLQKRQYEEAQQELTRLISDFPERDERDAWRVRLGMVLYLKGDYAAGSDYLAQLGPQLSDATQTAEAQYLAGLCFFFQNQFEKSAEALEASLKSSRQWRQTADALLLLARCRHKQNRLEEALHLVNEVLARHGQSSVIDQAHYRLGEFFYAAEKFDESQQAYAGMLKSWPDSAFAPYALYGQGWTQIKLQQFPQAAATFSAFLEKYQQHDLVDDSLLARAMARRQAGQPAQAIEDFNAYLKTDPPQPGRSDALYERGLAEVAAKQWPNAIATLQSILDQHPQYAHADKVLYELGWAHRGAQQEEQAVAQFQRLAAEYDSSSLAAEAWFHVGENQYQQEQYAAAAQSYTAASQKAQLGELQEKSLYKLGWSHFQQKEFQPALQRFQQQAKGFPDGVLYADALFMSGECLFKLEQYEPALTTFTSVHLLKPSSPQMEMLALLHGGQSASQVKQWAQSVQILDQLLQRFPETPYLAEARYERGWAKQHLNQLEEALADYEKAADERNALGARARFMMGEVRFTQKQFDVAVREFQRTMFLYGGDDAPDEIKVWQAKAGFEAGRCSEVLIQNATQAEDKARAIADAKKYYGFVTQKHPASEFAEEAKKRLAALARL